MISNYSQAIEFLSSAPIFIEKSAQRKDIFRILSYLNNPQDKIKALHVAGTNGKGSTCAYLNSVLVGCGYKVGLFTSPYLVDFEERIAINNVNISKSDVVKYISKISDVSEKFNAKISQFGYITIMMFLYFADHNVDYAIIEVGLGGADDPTNICNPILSMITSISLDHVEYLGDTFEKIARQKAGIIKNRVPVITSNKRADVLNVIENFAHLNDTVVHWVYPQNTKCDLTGTTFEFEGDSYTVPLLGEYQSENAAIAIKAALLLGINKSDILKNLLLACWNGRMQVLQKDPIVILDGAHNPDAAEKLSLFLNKLNKKAIMVCGMAADKDVATTVKNFSDVARYVITVEIDSPRSIDPDKLLAIFNDCGVDGNSCSNVEDAICQAKQRVKSQSDDQIIVICGSLYLAGEVLRLRRNDET